MKIIERLSNIGKKFLYVILDVEIHNKNQDPDDIEIDMLTFENENEVQDFLLFNDYKDSGIKFITVDDYGIIIFAYKEENYTRKLYLYSKNKNIYNKIYNETYN
jgi:hypothetical protein